MFGTPFRFAVAACRAVRPRRGLACTDEVLAAEAEAVQGSLVRVSEGRSPQEGLYSILIRCMSTQSK